MLDTSLSLHTFRLRNFKAVRDSGLVKFTPLTAFIGNNGSGKSSLIEGLETFHYIATEGLDEAMNRWRGFEFVWNSIGAKRQLDRQLAKKSPTYTPDEVWSRYGMEFRVNLNRLQMQTNVASSYNGDDLYISYERRFSKMGHVRITSGNGLVRSDSEIERDWEGYIRQLKPSEDGESKKRAPLEKSIFTDYDIDLLTSWQFLNLRPDVMSEPRLTKRTGETFKLRSDGSNIADYLSNIYDHYPNVLEGIVETLKYVLPYSKDVQPALTAELGRHRYLELSESDFKVPGWLLSTGTLRVLALLAVLRHPKPPPIVCIEEIENGLDPRTLNLIVEEIRRAVRGGRTQVIVTTHSPYLLDLLDLSQIVVVERDKTGQPIFFRPDTERLDAWKQDFAPGQLYTMGQLSPPSKGD